MKRIIGAIAAVLALSVPGVLAAGASADVVRTGNTFTAQPAYCSCWSTIDGYEFVGIPYSPFVRDVFLNLPASTPVVVDGDNTGIWDRLRADASYLSLPPVTSGSVQVDVGGTVEDDGTGGDGGDSEEGDDSRSSWGREGP